MGVRVDGVIRADGIVVGRDLLDEYVVQLIPRFAARHDDRRGERVDRVERRLP